MKLLLTSAGLSNETLKNEFKKLIGKDPKDVSVAFVITATIPEEMTEWVQNDLNNLKATGVENIKEINISDPRENWQDIINNAGVIWVEGGNTFYLLDEIRKTGFDKELPELLKNKLYVGVSAGSIIVGPDIEYAGWDDGIVTGDTNDVNMTDFTGLNIVSFGLFPHYEPNQKESLENFAKEINYPIYAIDNEMAALVVDGEMKLIGEGIGFKIN